MNVIVPTVVSTAGWVSALAAVWVAWLTDRPMHSAGFILLLIVSMLVGLMAGGVAASVAKEQRLETEARYNETAALLGLMKKQPNGD